MLPPQPKSKKKMHPAEAYIDGVLTGRITTCRLTRLAVERHVRDLREGAARGLVFDRAAAEHAIEFCRFVKHSKGEWAGETFVPSGWQQFVKWCVFGWYRKDGTRRFRECYLEVARKNGKSTDGAETGLYLFDADGEPGAEVYTAATKRDQARITHAEAVRMVKASPLLKKRIKTYKDNLHNAKTASKFEPLGADSDTADGLNVHGAIIDELHAHKTRDMCDVLETATGARRNPLIVYITTAGYDETTICWEKREYVRKVLTGIIEDDSVFGIIFTLDTKKDWPDLLTADEAKKPGAQGTIEDQWDDEKVWMKANPNLGVSCKADDLRRKARKAKETPAALNAFQRLHLNLWTSGITRWMPMPAWDACAVRVDEAALLRQPCYAGLDLSSTTDLTALVLVFPQVVGESLSAESKPIKIVDYKTLPFFWIPKDNMLERIKRDRVPYDLWEKQGHVYATPGNVVDYDFIVAKLEQLRSTFDILEIGYDAWGSAKIMTDLTERGFKVVPFRQGYGSMSGPSKELMTQVLKGRLHHGGHPVLRWNADNCVVHSDPAGNIKPDKAKSTRRIDGIVATIMGLDRATRLEGQTKKSVYETRGLVTL